MERGLLSVVLHAHLPFVRHPEHPEFLEEDWLFEAISETYLPLLYTFEQLVERGVHLRVTMGLTPPLCEMLADPLLQERYRKHLDKLVELTEREVGRTRGTAFEDAALAHHRHFSLSRELYVNVYRSDLLARFRALQDAGALEIITCGATHGFLPLMVRHEAKRAQIQVACRNYAKHFGRAPRGIWLPECGYVPGDDALLADEGLRLFFVDAHAIMFGTPRPMRAIYAPVLTPSGVAAFARDITTGERVWSSQIGYPGDPFYREFYRDLGYDLDEELIAPYLHSDGVRRNVGVKYHRVTGKVALHEKQPYIPGIATERAAVHAGDFLTHIQRHAAELAPLVERKPIVVSTYDAELYGHWWFEGPQFLKFLFEKIHYDQDEIRLATPIDYLEEYPDNQHATPSPSTWGAEGYSRVWVNGDTDWIYYHQHAAEDRMIELAGRFPDASGDLRRVLNQAARELLLAESSDWAFIITTGTTVQYAIKRFRDHIARFTSLHAMAVSGEIDYDKLADYESRDNIFAEIDYRVYRP
jgi:1,4-alpha-glucan branching enzyme